MESELAAIATEGVTDDELRRVRTMRIASFFFALEHVGGFGGVADRLNAYNVFRGDPSLITSDVEAVSKALRPQSLSDVAARISPTGRGSTCRSSARRKPPARHRSIVPWFRAAPAPSRYRPPSPEVIQLDCGIPLWVFPRSDLPTVAGAIVLTAGASLQQPGQAGLAQLTTVMLDEGTTIALGGIDRAGRRVDGRHDRGELAAGTGPMCHSGV